MAKIFRLFAAIVILLVIVIVVSFISHIGIDNLRHIYALHTSGQQLIMIEETENVDTKYITREDQPAELVKDRMSRMGWTFADQEGAGYIFTKDQERAIITIKKWNRNYYIITVPYDVGRISE